jgi:hypothetical protein
MGKGSFAVSSPQGPSQRPTLQPEEEEDDDDMMEADGKRSYSAIVGISDRLCTLQDNLEMERNVRFTELNEKMGGLIEVMNVSADNANLKFKGLRTDLGEFQKQVVRMRDERGKLAERKTEEIRDLDERLDEKKDAEMERAREAEARVGVLFEEQTVGVRKELDKETRLRTNYESTLRRFLEHDVVKLVDGLKAETTAREAMEMQIVRTAANTVHSLEQDLQEEVKKRQDTEEAMLRMMEDLVTRMEADIANERKDRAQKEVMLMNLLEFTVSKLQVSSQSL